MCSRRSDEPVCKDFFEMSLEGKGLDKVKRPDGDENPRNVKKQFRLDGFS